MSYLGEGLNPFYGLPAAICLVYMNIVGTAMNKKIGTSVPALLMGILSSLAISSLVILPAHGGLINNYKIPFIFVTLITLLISILINTKNGIKFKISRKIVVLSLIAYVFSLVYRGDNIDPSPDYWLYGKGFENGSKFIGDNIKENMQVAYFFTTIYRWLGSFFGMIAGQTAQTENLTLHLEYQSFTTLIWITIVIDLLIGKLKNIRYRVAIPSVIYAALSLKLFRIGFYGSFSIFIIMAIITNQNKERIKNSIIVSLLFIFMVSSIIVVLPMVVITVAIMSFDKVIIKDKGLRLTIPLIGMTTITVILVNTVPLFDLSSERTTFFLMISIESLIIMSIIVSLSPRGLKEIIFINAIFVLMANITLNSNGNIFRIESLPGVVMHRYLNFIFIGEYYNYSILLFTAPGAMHLLYEHFKIKKDLK